MQRIYVPNPNAADGRPVKAPYELLFVSTATAGPIEITDMTSLIGSGVGSLVIPKNSVSVGSTFRISMRASWGHTSSGVFWVNFGWEPGGGSFINGEVPVGVTNNLCFVNIDIVFTFRSLGVNGTVACTGNITIAGELAGGEIFENPPMGLRTINTTVDNTITAVVVLDNDADQFNCYHFMLERLNY